MNSSNQTSRRVFMMSTFAAAAGVATNQAFAQGTAPAMLSETDAQASALGYKADSTKVDAKKYPKHAATQLCSNCALYTGKDKDAAGGCGIFAGKQVAAKGWCSAWAKKA